LNRRNKPFVELLDTVAAYGPAIRQARVLLEPLVRYDSERGGDLIHTLRVYFAWSGNASRAAEVLFLHRNGMLYRLSRVEEILGVSVDDDDVRLAVELALRIIANEPLS